MERRNATHILLRERRGELSTLDPNPTNINHLRRHSSHTPSSSPDMYTTQNRIKLLSVSVVYVVSLQVCIAQTSDVRRVRVCVFSRSGRILQRGGGRGPFHATHLTWPLPLQLRTETVIYFWNRGETGRPINLPYSEGKRKLQVVLCWRDSFTLRTEVRGARL